jgi:hypothetical protein
MSFGGLYDSGGPVFVLSMRSFPVFLAVTLLLGVPGYISGKSVDINIQINQEVLVNEAVWLDVEISDVTGTPVPWEDLLEQHGRRVHIYVVHEVYHNILK